MCFENNIYLAIDLQRFYIKNMDLFVNRIARIILTLQGSLSAPSHHQTL